MNVPVRWYQRVGLAAFIVAVALVASSGRALAAGSDPAAPAVLPSPSALVPTVPEVAALKAARPSPARPGSMMAGPSRAPISTASTAVPGVAATALPSPKPDVPTTSGTPVSGAITTTVSAATSAASAATRPATSSVVEVSKPVGSTVARTAGPLLTTAQTVVDPILTPIANTTGLLPTPLHSTVSELLTPVSRIVNSAPAVLAPDASPTPPPAASPSASPSSSPIASGDSGNPPLPSTSPVSVPADSGGGSEPRLDPGGRSPPPDTDPPRAAPTTDAFGPPDALEDLDLLAVVTPRGSIDRTLDAADRAPSLRPDFARLVCVDGPWIGVGRSWLDPGVVGSAGLGPGGWTRLPSSAGGVPAPMALLYQLSGAYSAVSSETVNGTHGQDARLENSCDRMLLTWRTLFRQALRAPADLSLSVPIPPG